MSGPIAAHPNPSSIEVGSTRQFTACVRTTPNTVVWLVNDVPDVEPHSATGNRSDTVSPHSIPTDAIPPLQRIDRSHHRVRPRHVGRAVGGVDSVSKSVHTTGCSSRLLFRSRESTAIRGRLSHHPPLPRRRGRFAVLHRVRGMPCQARFLPARPLGRRVETLPAQALRMGPRGQPHDPLRCLPRRARSRIARTHQLDRGVGPHGHHPHQQGTPGPHRGPAIRPASLLPDLQPCLPPRARSGPAALDRHRTRPRQPGHSVRNTAPARHPLPPDDRQPAHRRSPTERPPRRDRVRHRILARELDPPTRANQFWYSVRRLDRRHPGHDSPSLTRACVDQLRHRAHRFDRGRADPH